MSSSTEDPSSLPLLVIICSNEADLDTLPPTPSLRKQAYILHSAESFWRDLSTPGTPLHSATILVRNPVANMPALPFGWTHQLAALDTLPPHLRLVISMSHGLDPEAVSACAARGVTILGTDGGAESTAVVGTWLALSVFRNFGAGERHMRAVSREKGRDVELMDIMDKGARSLGMIPGGPLGFDLDGKKVGVVGYGSVGRRMGAILGALGMEVGVFSRSLRMEVPEGRGSAVLGEEKGGMGAGLRVYGSVDDLVAEVDLVVIACPLTEETRHLINRERISKMKRGAKIVNVGRGKCIDEEALVWGLEEGIVGGAGLDVFEDEPRVHPKLLDMDNVAMTPHMGGASMDAFPKHYRSAMRVAEKFMAENQQS